MKNNLRTEHFFKKKRSISLRFFIRSFLTNSLLILIPLLFLGAFSIRQATLQGAEDAKRRTEQTLNQSRELLDSFYNHVDNAYTFFATNLRVSMQLRAAFSEPSLSLDSIRAAENIALSFQNMIYTDDYLQSLYVYYENNYSRIFAPLGAKLVSFSPEREQQLLEDRTQHADADMWVEFSEVPMLASEYPAPSLMIYRKLYRRGTGTLNGLLIFNFHATRMEDSMEDFLGYPGQNLFLLSPDGQVLWPEAGSEKSTMPLDSSFLSQLMSDSTGSKGQIIQTGYGRYRVSLLPPSRSGGLACLLLTPKTEIYRTAIQLTGLCLLMILCAVAMACLIAYLKTRHDYKYLSQIIHVLSSPDAAKTQAQQLKPAGPIAASPFEYIQLNVIRLFLEQDYLKIQDSEKTAKLQLAKLQALQHQINPHFLHNTLNGIYWESVKLTGSENQCSQMISCLSAIMRYSLGDPKEDVSIAQEANYLRQYTEIMMKRHSGQFKVRLHLAPDCAPCRTKRMLLQPLVENAILHGVRKKSSMSLICIRIHRRKSRIFFSVYDTGSGISPEKLVSIQQDLAAGSLSEDGQHIGMRNTNSRLILSYGPDAQLHIRSCPERFTVVWFSIPAERQEDHTLS